MSFLTQAAQSFGAKPAAEVPANSVDSNDPFASLRDVVRRQNPELPPDTAMKKGGKVKAEGMAKGGLTPRGWGKARGARGAKIY